MGLFTVFKNAIRKVAQDVVENQGEAIEVAVKAAVMAGGSQEQRKAYVVQLLDAVQEKGRAQLEWRLQQLAKKIDLPFVDGAGEEAIEDKLINGVEDYYMQAFDNAIEARLVALTP